MQTIKADENFRETSCPRGFVAPPDENMTSTQFFLSLRIHLHARETLKYFYIPTSHI